MGYKSNKNQLKHLINTTGFEIAFTYFDHQLYEYNGIELIPIEDFPSINEELKNTFGCNLIRETVSVYQPLKGIFKGSQVSMPLFIFFFK